MTLRLVSDNDEPGGVPYCTQIPCRTRGRRRPAAILLSKYGGRHMPACDECARWEHEMSRDGEIALAPLAGYVDWYAEAREAALATPEQIIEMTPSDLEEADEKVLRASYDDRVIYCHEWWCKQNGRLTQAEVAIADESTWAPACRSCATQRKADGTGLHSRIASLDTARKAEYWAMVDKRYAAKPAVPQSASRKPLSQGARWTTALFMLGSFILGIVLTGYGSNLNSANPDAAFPGPGAGFTVFGIFLIVAAVLTGLIWFGVEIARTNPPKPRPASSRQSASAAQGYQQGIPVGQLATTAALVGAEVLWHQKIRASQARARDSALGIAPLNNVHAGMICTTAMLQQRAADQRQQQAQQQRDATQRAILGELRQLNAPPRLIPGRRSL